MFWFFSVILVKSKVIQISNIIKDTSILTGIDSKEEYKPASEQTRACIVNVCRMLQRGMRPHITPYRTISDKQINKLPLFTELYKIPDST